MERDLYAHVSRHISSTPRSLYEKCQYYMCRTKQISVDKISKLFIVCTLQAGPQGSHILILKHLKQTPFHSFYLAGSFLYIRPAFAATIDKSRGQTMHRMSLYLPSPVFSHGTTICCALSRLLSFLYQNTTKMSQRLWRSHINTKGMTGNRTSCAIWLQPSLYPQH